MIFLLLPTNPIKKRKSIMNRFQHVLSACDITYSSVLFCPKTFTNTINHTFLRDNEHVHRHTHCSFDSICTVLLQLIFKNTKCVNPQLKIVPSKHSTVIIWLLKKSSTMHLQHILKDVSVVRLQYCKCSRKLR